MVVDFVEGHPVLDLVLVAFEADFSEADKEVDCLAVGKAAVVLGQVEWHFKVAQGNNRFDAILNTISLGFAVYPDQGASREELLNKVDVALYAVKMTGKGSMAGYHPDMVKEGRAQLGFNLRDLAVNLPGAFFIYRVDDGKILFANRELMRITECSSMEVFIEFIGRKVKGLIAPEDYAE